MYRIAAFQAFKLKLLHEILFEGKESYEEDFLKFGCPTEIAANWSPTRHLLPNRMPLRICVVSVAEMNSVLKQRTAYFIRR